MEDYIFQNGCKIADFTYVKTVRNYPKSHDTHSKRVARGMSHRKKNLEISPECKSFAKRHIKKWE